MWNQTLFRDGAQFRNGSGGDRWRWRCARRRRKGFFTLPAIIMRTNYVKYHYLRQPMWKEWRWCRQGRSGMRALVLTAALLAGGYVVDAYKFHGRYFQAVSSIATQLAHHFG
jgi:hypothetical protein